MILNNKSTNPLAYVLSAATEEQQKKVEADKKKKAFDPMFQPPILLLVVFPGVTGNHPKDLLASPAFMDHARNERPDEGIQIIDENSPIDKGRAAMNVADSVKLPDFDVVDYCTRVPADLDGAAAADLEKKQIRVIESIFKLPTLNEINKLEKRSNVVMCIQRQYKSIETSITKETRSR